MAAKKRPQVSAETQPARPRTPWYRRLWVVLSFLAAGFYGLLANGPTLLANAEKLPADVERVSGKFLSWYYEDQAWDGFWTAHPEGYVDIGDMKLSDVDLKLHLMAEHGKLGGEIATKTICHAVPFVDYFLLEGKVSTTEPKSATITAWDLIGGEKKYFFRFVVKREGAVVTVSQTEGAPGWLPPSARLGLHPDGGSEDDPYKQLQGTCATEKEEFLKKIRPPGLGREKRVRPPD